MKREGISIIFIHGFPWSLSYLLDHLLLFEIVLCVCGFFKVFLKMELRNGSHLYKNAYKVFVLKKSSKRCLSGVFESDFEKGFLCNGFCIYKNAYKVFVSKIVQRCVCEMCFWKWFWKGVFVTVLVSIRMRTKCCLSKMFQNESVGV